MIQAPANNLLPTVAAPAQTSAAAGSPGANAAEPGAFARELQRLVPAKGGADKGVPRDDPPADPLRDAAGAEPLRNAAGLADKADKAGTADAANTEEPHAEEAAATSDTPDLSAWLASLLGPPAAPVPANAGAALAAAGADDALVDLTAGMRSIAGAANPKAGAASTEAHLSNAASDAANGAMPGNAAALAADAHQAFTGDSPQGSAGKDQAADGNASASATVPGSPGLPALLNGVAAAAALQAAALATAASQAVAAEATVGTPLHSAEFAPALGSQIAHFARGGIEHARLHLNPADMGPIAVQLAMDGSQVRVDLVADVAATRQALEQSLPALAGALREAGFTLTGGGVYQHAREGGAQGQARGAPGGPQGNAGAQQMGEVGDVGDTAAAPGNARTQGLVDLYA